MENQKPTGYPSVDKPWLKYYGRTFSEEEIPAMSIYQLAYESNQDNLDNVAIDLRSSVNNFDPLVQITYREFFARVMAAAKSSRAIGIEKGEIIPIILPNVPEARILIYANSIIGAVSYPISPLLPADQLRAILSSNFIRTVFVFQGFYN